MKHLPPESWHQRFSHFTDVTNFHGFYDLYKASKKPWQLFWLLVISAGTSLAMYQTYQSVLQYRQSALLTITHQVEVEHLYAPKITLCYQHWVYWVDWQKIRRLNITKEVLLIS